MFAKNELNERYLVRAALYNYENESCIEIVCQADNSQDLSKLLTEGLTKALSGTLLGTPSLKVISIL